MSKRMKFSIAGGILIAIAGLAAFSASKGRNKATDVRMEIVEARDLVAAVTASGQVSPRTKVDVSSDVTGRIVRIAVKEGDMVTKGQFLLQIDPEQAAAAAQRSEAGLASARASSAQSQASLIQSQRNYQRSADIRKSNPQLISDEQLEQLKTQMEVNQALAEAAQQQVQQAAASVREARQSLSRSTIVAPMSGRVTRLNVEAGETAIMGTLNKDAATLLTISDMSVLETKVKVDETDVARISVGDSAQVQIDAFPDTTFVGRVVEISNSSTNRLAAGQQGDQAVDYEVTIQLSNPPAETRPDFSATAKVITDSRIKTLSIPIIALTVREDSAMKSGDTAVARPGQAAPPKDFAKRDVEGVFVVGTDNKVTFRPVKVGIAGDKYFEVVSGLKAGEKIVGGTYQAIRELKDGALVRDMKAADAKKAGDTKTAEAKT